MSLNDDAFHRLQESIDSWAEQVTQTRFVLAKSLSDSPTAPRPLFRLLEQPSASAKAEPSESVDDRGALQELVDTNRRLLEQVDALETELVDVQRRATDAERVSARLQSEIEFAREQLHLRNASSHEAATRQAEFEMRAEESSEALARSDIEIADLHQQLRSKDWRLLKTRNELDTLTEDNAQLATKFDAAEKQLEALQGELDDLRKAELASHASVEAARAETREQAVRLQESETKNHELSREIESLLITINKSAEELENAHGEISRLESAHDHGRAALAELEGLVELMEQREQAHKELVTQADQRTEELEVRLAEQLQTRGALEDELRNVQANTGDMETEALVELRGVYDELATSHMNLRDEIKGLQERIVERELALRRASADLLSAHTRIEAAEEEKLALQSRIEQVTLAAEQNSAGDPGHALLERALRDELEAVRVQLDRDALDQAALRRALKDEVDALRQVSTEKEFVLQHVEAESSTLSRREAELEEQCRNAIALSERLAAEATEANETRRMLEGEFRELASQTVEKDQAIRALRVALADLQERASRLETPDEAV